jgi:hypothetical protein
MASLQVGDEVFDEQGRVCHVVGKTPVHVDPTGTFRVTFDDGLEVICGGQHEWFVNTKQDRKNNARRTPEFRHRRKLTRHAQHKTYEQVAQFKPQTCGSIREVQQMLHNVRVCGGREVNYSVALSQAWETPPQSLPIDPYLLGVWLGDGSKNCGQITSNGPDIPQAFVQAGYRVTHQSHCHYYVSGLQTQLRSLGLLGKKSIPNAYLCGSKDQRLALLQGLMDTDGYCGLNGTVEFCNTNPALARGVYTLAASLALKPTYSVGRATLYGKECGPKYRVMWTGTVPVFRLPRKLARLSHQCSPKQRERYIIKIERVPDQLVQCIEVDSPSHLYLVTEGGIPTHNSMCGRWDAHMRALAHPGFRYCILRRTFPQLQSSHLNFLTEEMRELGGTYHKTDHIAYYPNGSMGFYRHCATDDHVLSLLSAEFGLMVFDELSTFEWDMFTKLAASVRVTKGSSLIAMVRGLTNPLGPSASKILQYFVDKDVDLAEDPDYNPSDWYSIHANLGDNPYLDREQYQRRFSGLPAHVRKAWVDGEFVLENALFDLQPMRDGKPYHVIHDLDLPKVLKAATIYRAIDSGWFPDPTIILWIAHLGNRYIVFNEQIYYKTTAAESADLIKEEEVRLSRMVGPDFKLRVATTYCDPSMDINTTADVKTIREIYEDKGVPMDCSINKRDYFATAIHNGLSGEAGENLPRLQFYVRGCPYLVRTIPQMRFDQKRPSFMADHKDDHAVVALAYFLLSHAADDYRESKISTALRPWMKPKRKEQQYLGHDNVRDRRDF